MTNPELADRILDKLVNNNKTYTLQELAEIMNETQNIVIGSIREMVDVHPEWFNYLDNHLGQQPSIKLNFQREVSVRAFIDKGGYVGEKAMIESLANAGKNKDKEESRRKQVEEENWIATTEYAKQAMKDSSEALRISKRSLNIARLTAIAAGLSLIASIWLTKCQ